MSIPIKSAIDMGGLGIVNVVNPSSPQDVATKNYVDATAGSGSSTLAALTDVLLSTPGSGQVLEYNGTKWVNHSPAYSDLTGTPQLPITLANAVHKWLNSYNSATGLFTQIQPDYSDLTGTPTLAQTLINASHKWLNSYSAVTGLFTQTQPDYSDLTGTPTLAQTKAAVTSNWIRSYDATTGLFTASQPAYTDITGTPQLAVTKTAIASNWLRSYDSTTGLFTASQPAYTDLTGTPTLAQTKAAIASNWLRSYDASTGLFTTSQPSYSDVTGFPQLAITGVYTNTQENLYAVVDLDGLDVAAEFAFSQPGLATEALVGAIAVPLSSTVYQANAVSGYITNGGSATAAVGVYGHGHATLSTGRVWGGNFLATDSVGISGVELTACEVDLNIKNAGNTGLGIEINGLVTSGATAIALWIAKPTSFWTRGIFFDVGATDAPTTSNAAIHFSPIASGVNKASQGIIFQGSDPTSGSNYVTLNANATGNLSVGFSNANAGITSSATQLKLQETGDALGSINMYLRNRSGSNGAIFENPSVCLTDFGMQTSAIITNIAINGSNVLTVTAVFASVASSLPSVGQKVTLSGLTTATFLNAQVVTIATISATQFTASFTHALYASAPDTGLAVAQNNVRAEFRNDHVSTLNPSGEIQFLDPTTGTPWLSSGIGATAITGRVVVTNSDSGRLPSTITGQAISGNVQTTLGSGTGKTYGVIGVARGASDVVGDRAYGGWFYGNAQNQPSTEVGVHAEVTDTGGMPAEFYTGGTQMAAIKGTGVSIGINANAQCRDTLQLLADAPRLYYGVGASHTNFKVSVQDSTSDALEISAGAGSQANPTADTYTPIVLVSVTGTVSIGNATNGRVNINGAGNAFGNSLLFLQNTNSGTSAGAEIIFVGDGAASRAAIKCKTGSTAGDVGGLTFIAAGQGADALDGQMTLNASGTLSLTKTVATYNNITTVANGIPSEYATVDLTAQSAAVATTTLYAVPASGAGQYRICWDAKVTRVSSGGTPSSTLGGMTIVYTDPDGVVQTITCPFILPAGTVATAGQTTNTTATLEVGIPLTLNCKASTNITYAFAYASGGTTVMQYNLHIRLEAL